jgi:hypothetical protein
VLEGVLGLGVFFFVILSLVREALNKFFENASNPSGAKAPLILRQ